MEVRSRFTSGTLIRLSQQGDPHAFSLLVHQLEARIERMIRGLVRSEGLDAEDLMQESLVHAFRSIRSLRASDANGFVSWFAGIVRNRIGHAWRAGRPRTRPRAETSLPWTLQRGVEPEILDSFRTATESSLGEGEPGVVREGLPVLTADRRLAFLLRDEFTSTLDTLGLVLDRGSHGGLRRSLRAARTELAPGDLPETYPGSSSVFLVR